ncbi:MAG: mycothiol synthase [Dermatophilaceae bacterium]
MQVENVDRLDAGQLGAVMALVRASTRVDGVAPLSEQVLLAAQNGLPTGTDTDTTEAPSTGAPHFLAYDGTHLAGYAHLERGPAAQTGQAGETGGAATAEVVVDPGHRRHGLGTTLIRALEDALQRDAVTSQPGAVTSQRDAVALHRDAVTSQPGAVTLRLWSHGHLDAARAFAARDGYSNVRELWAMRRSLRPDVSPLPAVRLPEGFTARHFVVGQDEEAWLLVNARAFVDHPEQGQMTRLDLDRRIAQSWFDATGLILIEDIRGTAPVLAASHWTKIVPAEDPQVSPTEGEVYVVGVEPAYQGLGLGRAVTVLGLAHLLEHGLVVAILYVDAENTAAVRTYSQLGFTHSAVDVMYSRVFHPPVPR